jgi:hypothetical protein
MSEMTGFIALCPSDQHVLRAADPCWPCLFALTRSVMRLEAMLRPRWLYLLSLLFFRLSGTLKQLSSSPSCANQRSSFLSDELFRLFSLPTFFNLPHSLSPPPSFSPRKREKKRILTTCEPRPSSKPRSCLYFFPSLPSQTLMHTQITSAIQKSLGALLVKFSFTEGPPMRGFRTTMSDCELSMLY